MEADVWQSVTADSGKPTISAREEVMREAVEGRAHGGRLRGRVRWEIEEDLRTTALQRDVQSRAMREGEGSSPTGGRAEMSSSSRKVEPRLTHSCVREAV